MRKVAFMWLLVFLYHLLQLDRHRRNGRARHLHCPIGSSANDNVEGAERRILVRKIGAEMAAAAFLSLDSGARDGFRDEHEVAKILRRVPPRVVFAVAR